MKLTIKNIENISGAKLPNLDGWSIGDIQDKGHIYEIDIQHNHTLKMVLHVNRENPYVDEWNKDDYTCTLLGANGSKYNWKLHRDDFKTKLGFIKYVGEMVLKLKREIEEQNFIVSLPSVSAGAHITQSLSLSFKESKPNPTYKIKKIMQELGQLPDYILHNIQYYIRKIV